MLRPSQKEKFESWLAGWKKLYLSKGGVVDLIEEYSFKPSYVLSFIVNHSHFIVYHPHKRGK